MIWGAINIWRLRGGRTLPQAKPASVHSSVRRFRVKSILRWYSGLRAGRPLLMHNIRAVTAKPMRCVCVYVCVRARACVCACEGHAMSSECWGHSRAELQIGTTGGGEGGAGAASRLTETICALPEYVHARCLLAGPDFSETTVCKIFAIKFGHRNSTSLRFVRFVRKLL